MKERPIPFSAPMVRAILTGTKTQTRRAIKAPGIFVSSGAVNGHGVVSMTDAGIREVPCPYGQPGDRLWVRETLDHDAARGHFYKATGMYVGPLVDYEREPPPSIGLPLRAIPSIHMPRWASRITLEVTGVRFERLQDISEDDAQAEGVSPSGDNWGAHRCAFDRLWEQINGPGSWEANPWVWVVSFTRVKA